MALGERDSGGGPWTRTERFGAMVNYGLLIAAPFSFGLLAVLAVAIAYMRRKRAESLARSHYDHQIHAFWTDLALVVVGALCGWGAVASGLGALWAAYGLQLPSAMTSGRLGWTTLALTAAWGLLWLWGVVGLFLGSILGAIRLAAGRPIGKRRRP